MGCALMAIAAAVYLTVNLPPPLPGLAMFLTFAGAAIALHKSHTINFYSPDKFGVILDVVRVGGLTVLCIGLIAVGKDERARLPLMLAAMAIVIIFVLQSLFRRRSAPNTNV